MPMIKEVVLRIWGYITHLQEFTHCAKIKAVSHNK